MAQVTIRINGYSYQVGCEDGQEPHLTHMAGEIERRIDSIKALGQQSGEARLLMLASLLLADELHDLRTDIEAGKAGLAAQPAPAAEPAKRARLRRLAARAEEIAADLSEA
ncbi:MAG: cell division protein ZapA [Rhodospirillales bacterium 20-60-12]|nr:MAG: cell division protein ZapA [Rhodospirillales bacterium 20-60-12]HQT67553.1 cell division protein ZapA [Acetobacteraceae bacterium]HQU01569.1 cell division protein ZapA [Acetobacteraceae bacterium]